MWGGQWGDMGGSALGGTGRVYGEGIGGGALCGVQKGADLFLVIFQPPRPPSCLG